MTNDRRGEEVSRERAFRWKSGDGATVVHATAYDELFDDLVTAERHAANLKAAYDASIARIEKRPCQFCERRREIAQARGAKRRLDAGKGEK